MLLAAVLVAQSPPPERTSLAVYPIKAAGAEASLATAMTALLGSQLTPSPKLRVIEDSMLKTVMERQAMNVSDACDDTSCQVAIGKLVQAQKLVTGNLAKFGPKYILSLKVADVGTGATEFSTEDKCTCSEDQLDQLVTVAGVKIRNHFGEELAVPPLPQGPAPAPGTAPMAAQAASGIPAMPLQLTGSWNSTFGILTFSQQGSQITGQYSYRNGQLQGNLEGSILRGSWSEGSAGSGDLEFTFAPDGNSFAGKWRSGFGSGAWNNWTGTRTGTPGPTSPSTGDGQARLWLDKTSFAPGESAVVHFTAPGSWAADAWIGIIPSNIAHGNEAVNDQHDVSYQYLNKRTSGDLIFAVPTKPGAYDFRLNDTDANGSEAASVSFTVGRF